MPLLIIVAFTNQRAHYHEIPWGIRPSALTQKELAIPTCSSAQYV